MMEGGMSGSRLSSSCSTIPAVQRGGNSMEMVRTLYEELTPQLSKSYRPHVVYIPPDSSAQSPRHGGEHPTGRRNKLKTANIVIDAIGRMQKSRDLTLAKKGRDSEKQDSRGKERRPSLLESIKENSQSMPNLSGTG